jgi:hypothetical protein
VHKAVPLDLQAKTLELLKRTLRSSNEAPINLTPPNMSGACSILSFRSIFWPQLNHHCRLPDYPSPDSPKRREKTIEAEERSPKKVRISSEKGDKEVKKKRDKDKKKETADFKITKRLSSDPGIQSLSNISYYSLVSVLKRKKVC